LAWTLEFSEDARRRLKAMDQAMARRIVTYMRERVATSAKPRIVGQALQGKKYQGQLRYRVGDWRIIAELRDSVLTIVVIDIGHRREIYR
jgi:mRNA interferase RelE/StbE